MAEEEKRLKEEKSGAGKDDENAQAAEKSKQDETPFYKGFHRRDVNNMLKNYAQSMYGDGVRNEELLLIKVKPDITSEVVERAYVGSNVTSFFNPDKEGEEKKLNKLVDKNGLDEEGELKVARKIFTPDEMLKIWN